jgi:hypothetical protein
MMSFRFLADARSAAELPDAAARSACAQRVRDARREARAARGARTIARCRAQQRVMRARRKMRKTAMRTCDVYVAEVLRATRRSKPFARFTVSSVDLRAVHAVRYTIRTDRRHENKEEAPLPKQSYTTMRTRQAWCDNLPSARPPHICPTANGPSAEPPTARHQGPRKPVARWAAHPRAW